MGSKPSVPGPRLGPYCCFTGRYVRPLTQRILYLLFHVAACGIIPALFVYHLGDALGQLQALAVGGAAVVAYLVALAFPRLHFAFLIALAGVAGWSAWESRNEERPIVLRAADEAAAAQREEAPTDLVSTLESALERGDEFFRQAVQVASFPLFAAGFALLALLAILHTASSVTASRKLPKRLWFARFHPVWRRPYAAHESPHPVVGLAYVARDALLTEKLVWLKLDRRANALRFQATTAAGSQPGAGGAGGIPLSELSSDVVLHGERGRWHLDGTFTGAGDAKPAKLRLFLRRLNTAPTEPDARFTWSAPEHLPVRDVFAADNTVYGKSYAEEQDTCPLGVLVDSRPNPDATASALPRFSVVVERAGRVWVEYPHPDLLGGPYRDEAEGTLHLPWRSATDEPQDLVLDPLRDSLHGIRTADGTYHLLFVALAEDAIGLPEALGLHRADDRVKGS